MRLSAVSRMKVGLGYRRDLGLAQDIGQGVRDFQKAKVQDRLVPMKTPIFAGDHCLSGYPSAPRIRFPIRCSAW